MGSLLLLELSLSRHCWHQLGTDDIVMGTAVSIHGVVCAQSQWAVSTGEKLLSSR